MKRLGTTAGILLLGAFGLGVFYFLAPRSDVPLTAREERNLKQGDVFKECPECPTLVVVPPGSFTMGSPKSEESSNDEERPQRPVDFARAFAVAKFEVSFAEWDACVADRGCGGYRPDDEAWGRGKQPVINVSWLDAKSYIAWLNRKMGRDVYRLPTEAEWEYVARAGTTTPFWFGSRITADQANYHATEAYGGGPVGTFRQRTVAVDSFAANGFGLHNVHGNVWEWVEDCYGGYIGATSDGHSVRATPDCRNRVLRGGSWVSNPKGLRSAYRDVISAGRRNSIVGFRLARTLSP